MSIPALNADMTRIIEVANELVNHGSTAGSTSEQIAAAFLLNDIQYLPHSYPNMIEAWMRLGSWQEHVYIIHAHYRHLITFKA